MSNHSVVEHRANYHYIRIEEDFLAICSRGECSPHCKALILAILEHWTNTKQGKDEGEYIYLTMPEWVKHTYMLYERNVLTDCIKELMSDGLISRRAIKRYDQDTFEYKLELHKINAMIKELPEKAIKETSPNLHPYIAFKDHAKAKRTKKREEGKGVGDKSRTPSKGQKGVREKSTTVRDLSPTVREKSPQHSIPTQITDSTSKGRSSTNTHEREKENATTTTDIDKISPDVRRKMQKLLTPDERVWFEEIWCASNFVVEPDLTQSLASHIQRLARSITTVEKLNALYVYAQGKLLANPKRVDDIVKPGNLANTLNDFLLSEQKAAPQEEPPAGVTFRADTAEYLRDAAVPQGCNEERALAEVQARFEQSAMSADAFDSLVTQAIMTAVTRTYTDGDEWLHHLIAILDKKLESQMIPA